MKTVFTLMIVLASQYSFANSKNHTEKPAPVVTVREFK